MLKRFGLLAIASLMTISGYANDEEVKPQDQIVLVNVDEEKNDDTLCCNGLDILDEDNEEGILSLSTDEEKNEDIIACSDCKN